MQSNYLFTRKDFPLREQLADKPGTIPGCLDMQGRYAGGRTESKWNCNASVSAEGRMAAFSVAQSETLLYRRMAFCGSPTGLARNPLAARPADYQSAKQQIVNLRYPRRH